MKQTTKRRSQLTRKIDWNIAIAEGRVMRSQGGLSFASFATRSDALAAVARCLAAGLQADMVDPSLADKDYLARADGADYRTATAQQSERVL